MQPWTNVWRTLSKINHTALNGHFNQTEAAIYIRAIKTDSLI